MASVVGLVIQAKKTHAINTLKIFGFAFMALNLALNLAPIVPFDTSLLQQLYYKAIE